MDEIICHSSTETILKCAVQHTTDGLPEPRSRVENLLCMLVNDLCNVNSRLDETIQAGEFEPDSTSLGPFKKEVHDKVLSGELGLYNMYHGGLANFEAGDFSGNVEFTIIVHSAPFPIILFWSRNGRNDQINRAWFCYASSSEETTDVYALSQSALPMATDLVPGIVTVDDELAANSTNPIQNGVVTAKINEIEAAIGVAITELSEI